MASSSKILKKMCNSEPVWTQVVPLQKEVDEQNKTVDVHLVCENGYVPAHACLLQSMSPFFRKVFTSQGENYPAVRIVILPDYQISDIRKAAQYLYVGSVIVDNAAQAERIQEILTSWEVDLKGVNLQNISKIKNFEKPTSLTYFMYEQNNETEQPEVARGSSSVVKLEKNSTSDQSKKGNQTSKSVETPKESKNHHSLRRRTQKSFAEENSDEDTEEVYSEPSESEDSETESEVAKPITRSTRSATKTSPPSTSVTPSGRPTRSSTKVNTPQIITSDNDEADPLDSTSSSEYDTDDEMNGRKGRKTRLTAKKKPSIPPKSTPPPNPAKQTTSNSNSHSKPATAKEVANKNSSSDSDSDSGGDDNLMKFYAKNPDAFAEASKVCDKCKRKYTNAKDASDCVTSRHKMVRCYFCFHVTDNTEKLFDHYADKHKKAGKESTLLCPFCQVAVPFKSVSTHVISNHLFAATPMKPPAQVAPGNPGPDPKRAKTDTGNQTGISKRRNPLDSDPDTSGSDDNSKVNQSNMLIKKRSASGKMKKFLVDKH